MELDRVEHSITWFEVYLEDKVQATLLLHALQSTLPADGADVRHCGAKDWTTFWRHHFHPVEVGETLFILPEWLRGDVEIPPGRQTLLINPGLSFGTGNHFTTHYCLRTLDRLHRDGFRPDRMLDAGCGSAILSIAARKFGWDNIHAVDNDEMAIDQARENLLLNDVHDGIRLQVIDLTRQGFEATYPLVVANLYGGLLMELAPRLVRACTDTLILSGIRTIEAEAVSTIFSQLGAREIECDADPEWCGMRLDCRPVHQA